MGKTDAPLRALRQISRRPVLISLASTAILAAVLVADAYLLSRELFGGPPRPVVTEFHARDGRRFFTLHHRRVVVDPVSTASLDVRRRDAIERFFDSAAPKTGVAAGLKSIGGSRFALAYHAALILSNGARAYPQYRLQRVRDYKNAVLFTLAVPRERLLDAVLNWKPVHGTLFGAQTIARIVHAKGIAGLDDSELSEVLAYVFRKSAIAPGRRHAYTRALWAADVESRREADVPGRDFIDACLRFGKDIPTTVSTRVFTTVDLDFQEFMEALAEEYFVSRVRMPANIRERIERLPRLQAAAVLIDSASAEVRALIGGVSRNSRGRFNRAVRARRQISSTFKPLLYAEAIDRLGLMPSSMLEDRPIVLANRDGSPWKPRNFYSYYLGPVTIHKALAMSINTVSVQLIRRIGVDAMAGRARAFFAFGDNDIERRIAGESSLALGAIDLTPLELARGYLALARGGVDAVPRFIRRIERMDQDRGHGGSEPAAGSVPLIGKNEGVRLLSAETAAVVTDILKSVFTPYGTAGAFMGKRLGFEMAGKSGSSPDDSWFVGYNPELLVCAWAGYDVPVARADLKLPLFVVIPFWIMLMERSDPGIDHFAVPVTLERRHFCAETGCPPGKVCTVVSGLFRKGGSDPRCGGT